MRRATLRLLHLHDATPAERKATLWTAVAFFCVLFAYYLLRPLRENVGTSFGTGRLLWLFVLTFVLVTVLNQPYLALVRRLPSRRFLPYALHGFAASFVVLAVAFAGGGRRELGELGFGDLRGAGFAFFYSWVTAFSVCGVTLIWVHTVEWFSLAQGKRLFGFVSVGGTLGAMAGSELSYRLAAWSYSEVMLCAAAAVEVGIGAWLLSLRHCERMVGARPAPGPRPDVSFAEGLQRVLRTPYLRGIAAFVLISSVTATTFYYQRQALVREQVLDEAGRRMIEASINWWYNGLALGVQLFFTSRVLLFCGVGLVLCVMPVASLGGLLTLALWPVVGVYGAVEVLRRMLQFAFDKPAREVLYTPLDAHDKYVSKAVVDTAVFRFGDLVGSLVNDLLLRAGLGGGGFAAVSAPVMVGWLWLGRWLGRRCREHERAQRAPIS